ncbi:50S ribosomal protein L5 [Candidatus Saccharibacteria bacterium]|nr:50S ribosomal protein L5 [Candidatus Saccharibacteria bacterium]
MAEETTSNVTASTAKQSSATKNSPGLPRPATHSLAAKGAPRNDNFIPRLKTLYRDQYAKELMKDLSIKNLHDVPKLEKIIVAAGTGRGKDDKKHQEIVGITLRKITGQQPTERIAKKSIASFKIRKGMGAPLGHMVTLRGDRMYEFLDRLVNVAMPRIRDFHGASARAFDGQGNYTLGITEQSIFPELTFEDTAVLHGLQVTFVISGDNPAQSRALLEKFGIPFERDAKGGK